MKRGLNSLASIAVTAPFVGILGWVLGFYNSFPGGEGEKSAMLAIVTGRLSESLMPIELGLLVGLLAYFGHKCLLLRIEDFDLERRTLPFNYSINCQPHRLSALPMSGPTVPFSMTVVSWWGFPRGRDTQAA
jgi:hypothetical protein